MINSGQKIIENEWNHVAVKMKKSTGEVSFFLNNSNVSFSNVDLTEFSFNSNNQPLKIGVDDRNASGNFVGEMDNMTIYDKAVSHAQIEDYHSTFPILQLDTSGDTSVLKADVTLGESANINSKNQNNEQNSAYNFDGSSSSYVAVSDQSYNDYRLNQLTFSAWINPSVLTQNAPLLTKSLLQGQMQIGINASKRLFFKINNKVLENVNVLFDQVTDLINVGVTITPVTDSPLNYYIMAFPYSKSPKQNIIDVFASTNTSNIVHNVISTTTTINESLSTVVFDNGTNSAFTTVPKVHVYIIVSTNTLTDLVNNKSTLLLNKDYLISEKVVKFVPNVNEPYVNISDISSVTSGALTFSASILSSVMYISNVKFVVFEDIVDLTDVNAVKTFINTYGTNIPSSSTPINILKTFTNVQFNGNAFSDLSGTNPSTLNNTNIYKIAVMATYSNGMSAFKVLEQAFSAPVVSLLTSVQFSDTTDKLQISGNMVAFDSGTPIYKIIAISKDNVTISDVTELLEIYTDNILKGTIYPQNTSFTNLTIPTVLVPNANGSFDIVDSSIVNYAQVYLYCSNGIRSQDVYDKIVIDPNGVEWYDTAQYWRIKVLSIHGDGITSNDSTEYPDEKIMAGSYNANNHPGDFGQLKVTQLGLYDDQGDFKYYAYDHMQLTPDNIILTNSDGTTHENVLQLQNNDFTSGDQLNNILTNFGLKEYINIDYIFSSPKKITKIAMTSESLSGIPIDMEIYNSQDNSTWSLHSRLSYQTGDIPDDEGNFSTVTISNWMQLLKFNANLGSWYFKKYSDYDRYNVMMYSYGSYDRSNTKFNVNISESQNEYPYEGFTDPVDIPDPKPHVQIVNHYYSHFENKGYITMSVFSSVTNIQTVYKPLVFKDNYVNDDQHLKSFISNLYNTYNYVHSSDIIGQFRSRTITIEVEHAFYYNYSIYNQNYIINDTDTFDYIAILVVDDQNNETLEIVTSKVFQSLSTLKTQITTASFSTINDQIILSGMSVDSNSGTTTYKAIATSQPDLQPSEVESLIENYPDAVTIVTDKTFDNVFVPKVLVPNNNNASYIISDSSSVNKAFTYLYGTDGINKALDSKIIYPSLEQYPTQIDIQLSEINTLYTIHEYVVIYEIELYDINDNIVPYTVSYYHPNITNAADVSNLYSDLEHQYITYRQRKALWRDRSQLIDVTFLTLQASASFSRVHVYWETESKKNGLRIIGNNGMTLVTENGTGSANTQDYDPSSQRYRRDWLTHGKALTVARFTDIKPYVKITNISNITYNQFTISGTVFSSVTNIVSVKAAAFAYDANLDDKEAIQTFVINNGVTIDLTVNQYEMGSFLNISLANYYTEVNGTSQSIDNDAIYQVVVVATDSGNNIGYHNKVQDAVVINTVTATNPEDNTQIVEETYNDESSVTTVYASDGVTVQSSTEVSAPVNVSDGVTEITVTNKDATGTVTQTTVTTTNTNDNTVTVVENNADSSNTTTVYESDGVTVQSSTEVSAPVNVSDGVTEITAVDKDASGTVTQTTTTTTNTNDNTVTVVESYQDESSVTTVYASDGVTVQSSTEVSAPVNVSDGVREITVTIKNDSGNVTKTIVVTLNTNDNTVTEAESYPDGSSVITKRALNGTVIQTTTTTTNTNDNTVTVVESYQDESSVTTVYASDGVTVQSSTEVSAPVNVSDGVREITVTNKDATGTVTQTTTTTTNTNDNTVTVIIIEVFPVVVYPDIYQTNTVYKSSVDSANIQTITEESPPSVPINGFIETFFRERDATEILFERLVKENETDKIETITNIASYLITNFKKRELVYTISGGVESVVSVTDIYEDKVVGDETTVIISEKDITSTDYAIATKTTTTITNSALAEKTEIIENFVSADINIDYKKETKLFDTSSGSDVLVSTTTQYAPQTVGGSTTTEVITIYENVIYDAVYKETTIYDGTVDGGTILTITQELAEYTSSPGVTAITINEYESGAVDENLVKTTVTTTDTTNNTLTIIETYTSDVYSNLAKITTIYSGESVETGTIQSIKEESFVVTVSTGISEVTITEKLSSTYVVKTTVITENTNTTETTVVETYPNAVNPEVYKVITIYTGIGVNEANIKNGYPIEESVPLVGLLDPTTQPSNYTNYENDYTSLRGGYAVKHLYTQYTGAHIRISRSSDNTEMDVVFNANGVSTEYESWIGTDTANVVIWYDQSDQNPKNHATAQGTVTFDYENKRVVLGSDGYFSLPDGTVPYDDDPYTMIFDHGSSADDNGVLISSGYIGSNRKSNVFRRATARYTTNYKYTNSWYGDDFFTDDYSYNPAQVVTFRYDNTLNNQHNTRKYRSFHSESTIKIQTNTTTRSSEIIQNVIGVLKWPDDRLQWLWKGELYSVLIYEKALDYSDIDFIANKLRPS